MLTPGASYILTTDAKLLSISWRDAIGQVSIHGKKNLTLFMEICDSVH
jgi:hypothetical protein